MKLIYEIREVRKNIICRWYNLDAKTATKFLKEIINESKKLIENGENVKIYMTAKKV